MSVPSGGKKEEKAKEVVLYIPESTLKAAGFQRGTSGWYYFSDDDDNTHIHLGAFTGSGTPAGSRRITFVSFKVNDKGKGNIPQLGSGKYDGDQMPDCGDYTDAFRAALEKAGII